jgi:hypothetical protein
MTLLLREVRIRQKGCGTTNSGAASMSQAAVTLVCVPSLLLLQQQPSFPNHMEGHG